MTDADKIKILYTIVFKRPVVRSTEGLGEKGRESKEKSKEKILRLMIENSAITIQEIAEILGMSLAGVEKSIRTLKQQERLRRIGPDKGGYWEVVKK
ncbi:MAG: winged helix-turn-helix transcriptional regulator [Candidatus Roizmanbacteria bacterium]|nr:winged helix-turn-helix transcriptional regulator [Candidatus Roizmanbacteria bacterium]